MSRLTLDRGATNECKGGILRGLDVGGMQKRSVSGPFTLKSCRLRYCTKQVPNKQSSTQGCMFKRKGKKLHKTDEKCLASSGESSSSKKARKMDTPMFILRQDSESRLERRPSVTRIDATILSTVSSLLLQMGQHSGRVNRTWN